MRASPTGPATARATSCRGDASNAWQFLEADRVFCPSEDVRTRLARYGYDARAIVVPHEPVAAGPWPLRPPTLGRGRKLRVAVLGVLAGQKGRPR